MAGNMKVTDDRFGKGTVVEAVFHRYVGSNNVAIQLVQCDTGEQWCMASVNVPGSPLPDHLVAIKTYSENEGVDTILVSAGVIHPEPVRYLACGHATTPIFRLTEVAKAKAAAVPRH